MTPKQYLKQVPLLSLEIDEYVAEQTALKQSLLKTARIRDDDVRGGEGSLEDVYIKIIKRGKIIDEKIDELVELKLKITQEIDEMEPSPARQVLRLRYVACKDWEEIAEDMSYTLRHVYRIHGQALVDFRSLFPEKFEKK